MSIFKLFDDLKNDVDCLKINFAKLMGYMLTHNKLEIKIAIPKDRLGMYHDKIGIMHFDDGEKLSFSGSVNETSSAWKANSENFEVFCRILKLINFEVFTSKKSVARIRLYVAF